MEYVQWENNWKYTSKKWVISNRNNCSADSTIGESNKELTSWYVFFPLLISFSPNRNNRLFWKEALTIRINHRLYFPKTGFTRSAGDRGKHHGCRTRALKSQCLPNSSCGNAGVSWGRWTIIINIQLSIYNYIYKYKYNIYCSCL